MFSWLFKNIRDGDIASFEGWFEALEKEKADKEKQKNLDKPVDSSSPKP